MRRVANKQKKQDPKSRIKNKTPFSFWVTFDCDAQDALLLLIVIISMIHDFLSFYIVVSKCEEWKEEALLWLAPGDINIVTPLQQSIRWDITSLIQGVNLICAKKVYYFDRPKYVFLCVNSRTTSSIFKTCFGQSEQV